MMILKVFLFVKLSMAISSENVLLADQLSRLHMILKPFMLRRVKRDVENELSDKVCVVSCLVYICVNIPCVRANSIVVKIFG